MKRFITKEALDKWITDNFYKEPAGVWELPPAPDMAEVANKLSAEGYNLDNLIANGHAYEINGHTNDGWLFDDEASEECRAELERAGKLIKRNSIRGKRMEAGLSRAEMSRIFEIPVRTLEDWESGKREPAPWAEKLIVEKLESMRA